MTQRFRVALVVGGLTVGATAAADDGPSEGPGYYVLAGVGTTGVYVQNDGSASGPVGDVSPCIGAGATVSRTVSVEVDASVTLTSEGYQATGAGPAVVWAFHPNIYGTMRLFVPFHPDPDLVLMPGIGVTAALTDHLAPFLEVDLASAIGHGRPDLAVGPSAGLSWVF